MLIRPPTIPLTYKYPKSCIWGIKVQFNGNLLDVCNLLKNFPVMAA